jgi:serine/threonine-protein kinase
LLERHFRSLPAAYFERHSPADIARHLRLLSRLNGPHPVDVEVRPLAAHTFEVLVVGEDLSGTVAIITTALAADAFDLEDLHVTSYLDTVDNTELREEPRYFVIVLWVSGSLRGRTVGEVAQALRARLQGAFGYLAQGNLHDAQAAAAETAYARSDSTRSSGVRRSATAPAGTVGLILGGDFRLERRLMVGGMSEVHLATQLSLNRTVAVKLIRHEGDADDDMLARFNREATVLGQFNSPYIVPVLAAGTVPDHGGGILGWMAMEYLAGGDLAHWLTQHGLPPVELATRWLRQALEGLHYAHRRSVLHRDLKPHNLLLTGEANIKVSDFGLLKRIQRSAARSARGAIVGTPHYMSPEQALGERLDERSDIFSLGTTFFQVFSGRLPFHKTTPQAVLVQIAQEDAPRLQDAAPQAPRALSVILGRMMSRRAEERYQDVGVILEDLASYERRGLLRCADSVSPVPLPGAPPVPIEAETQAYQPPQTDDMI